MYENKCGIKIKFKRPPCISNICLTLKTKTKMRQVVVPELDGYANIGGKLIASKLAEVIIEFTKETDVNGNVIATKQKIANMIVETNKGKVRIPTEDYFRNVEDFKENIPCNCTQGVYLANWLRNVELTNDKNIAYVIENGKVVSKNFDFTKIHITFNTHSGCDLHSSYIKSIITPDIPDGSFQSKEEAIAHLDIEVIDENGESKKTIGIANLLKLDEEQSDLVFKISTLMRRARELGVMFISNSQEQSLNAINTNNLATCGITYGEDCEQYYNIKDSIDFDMGVKVIACDGDEDVLQYEVK